MNIHIYVRNSYEEIAVLKKPCEIHVNGTNSFQKLEIILIKNFLILKFPEDNINQKSFF